MKIKIQEKKMISYITDDIYISFDDNDVSSQEDSHEED